MRQRLSVVLGGAIVVAVAASCGTETSVRPTQAAKAAATLESAAAQYPDLEALYAGDQGVYRGCGPNNGVCHNSKEFPNFATAGAIADNIGVPCNQKRDRADEIHDLCEVRGDYFRHGDEVAEVGYFAPGDGDSLSDARTIIIHLHHPLAKPIADDDAQDFVRKTDTGFVKLLSLGDSGVAATLDPKDSSRRTLILDLKRPPPPGPNDPQDPSDQSNPVADMLSKAGLVSDPSLIQLGDPNRNDVYGVDLGGRLILPGNPGKSYLITRLTDPSAGPPMPRANCCFWSKSALRAIYCWVAGLEPDGSNAAAKIDYAKCPPGPLENIEYPEPGVACESAGKCPVQPRMGDEDEASWSRLYANVFRVSCGGGKCHVEDSAGGLDFSTEEVAYKSARARVVPGDAKSSVLFSRISPDSCVAPHCSLMPRDRAPLDLGVRHAIERWIKAGAPRK